VRLPPFLLPFCSPWNVDVRPQSLLSVGTGEGTEIAKLTVVGVRNAKPGRHADGLGLYLLVKPSGARSWLLRVQVDKRRRDIGLGSITDLTLTEAREKAATLRKAARKRLDPVAERDKDRRPVPTFAEAAKACHADLKSGWSARHVATFLSSLERHAFPAIGGRRIDQIEAHDLRDMLAPIWTEIPDMARKVRQRATTVLNYAKSKGWRAAEAPGKSVIMGLARHGAGLNYAAMPYSELPGFVQAVHDKSVTMGRLALLFVIHTAARSGEVRHARWSHIDFERKLWNRPAELMKAKAAHSVTLNDAALAVLVVAAELRTTMADVPVFPNSKGTPLSDMTLSKVLRDAKLPFTCMGSDRASVIGQPSRCRTSQTRWRRRLWRTRCKTRSSARTSAPTSSRCAARCWTLGQPSFPASRMHCDTADLGPDGASLSVSSPLSQSSNPQFHDR
jgi:integrase